MIDDRSMIASRQLGYGIKLGDAVTGNQRMNGNLKSSKLERVSWQKSMSGIGEGIGKRQNGNVG